MKKLLVTGLLATFSVVAPMGFADTSANAPSSALVVLPLTITKTADLYFGAFMNAGIANNDYIDINDTNGLVTYSAPSHFQPIPSDPPHRATFIITGAEGYDVMVTKTITPYALGGGMQVQTLDEEPSTPVTLPAGPLTLYVGGRLKVINAVAVTPGTYTMPFSVTVEYQ